MMMISVILHENVSFSFSAVTGFALDLGAGKNSWQQSRLDWETFILLGRTRPRREHLGLVCILVVAILSACNDFPFLFVNPDLAQAD